MNPKITENLPVFKSFYHLRDAGFTIITNVYAPHEYWMLNRAIKQLGKIPKALLTHPEGVQLARA